MKINGQEYVGAEEAARIMGLHPDHVRRLARNGKIPAIRIGRTWIISAEDIISYIPGPKGFAAHPRTGPRKYPKK